MINMNKELISVIIPVYNVEKYLKKCVNSIIDQSYKNLEIVLVDDGSTDKSGDICDDYLKIDERIKVIHKNNGGLSDARNVGIDNSTGVYIGFIDSDDFIKNDMFEILYNAIKKTKADLAMCRVIDCYGSIPDIKNENLKVKSLSPDQAIANVLESKEISVNAVSKLYKKELFDNLKFEVKRTAEDAIIMIELITKCKKIAYVNAIEYYYIHRENSITTSEFNPRNGYDVIYAYKKNYEIIKSKFPNLIELAEMRLCWAHFFVLDSMVKSKYKIDKNVVKYLRRRFIFILRNSSFTKSRKISMFLLMINVKLYAFFVRKYYKKKRQLME